MPAFTPPSRGRDRGGDEWSCHDGKFFAAAVLSGEARAPMERQFVASQQRETASSSRRVSRRLWPAERGSRDGGARPSASIVAKARSWRKPAEAAAKAASDASAVPPAARAAAEAGDLAPLREWLDASAAPDLASAALLRACGVGDAGLARALLAVGAPVDGCGARGTTALMLASISGHEAAVRALLEGRAAVDQGDEKGMTALMWASHKGHLGVARALLAAGARADLADAHGQRASFYASSAADVPGSGTRRGAVAALLRTLGRRGRKLTERPLDSESLWAPTAAAAAAADAAASELLAEVAKAEAEAAKGSPEGKRKENAGKKKANKKKGGGAKR